MYIYIYIYPPSGVPDAYPHGPHPGKDSKELLLKCCAAAASAPSCASNTSAEPRGPGDDENWGMLKSSSMCHQRIHFLHFFFVPQAFLGGYPKLDQGTIDLSDSILGIWV